MQGRRQLADRDMSATAQEAYARARKTALPAGGVPVAHEDLIDLGGRHAEGSRQATEVVGTGEAVEALPAQHRVRMDSEGGGHLARRDATLDPGRAQGQPRRRTVTSCPEGQHAGSHHSRPFGQRVRHARSAPVMMATTSVMLCVSGLTVAARLPRRWMWMRSATSNTWGML